VKPNFDLTGKTVLITGASRGIGRAIAEACWRSGGDLVLGVRNPADVAEAHNAAGRIDVLVNNVGLGPENLATDVTEDDFDLTVRINLKGTFFVSQAVGRLMIADGGGRIINVSSQAGTVVLKGESVYCMTKAAINHLTRCLAFEWAPHKVNVNSIAPTFIWTDGTRPYLDVAENREHVLSHIPLGRIGDPVDVVGAVVFLASPASALITGANLMIDGGWSLE
jgi:NAD(P)-dependent dehydrogenase (short-subunit alcohol dehydrogenase family)